MGGELRTIRVCERQSFCNFCKTLQIKNHGLI